MGFVICTIFQLMEVEWIGLLKNVKIKLKKEKIENQSEPQNFSK